MAEKKALTSEMIAETFKSGFDCSQVVLEQYAEELGLTTEQARKLTACFGGGMGRGETCGAIVGAMMVIGMKYGHSDPAHMEQKDVMGAKRAEFLEKFLAKYPSCICNELLGHDITDPEGLKQILDQGLLFEFCPKLVSEVVDILKEI